MRIIFLLVLVLGLGLAGYASFLVMQQIEGYQNQIARLESQVQRPIETVDVVVSGGNLRFGQELTRDDVLLIPWPANVAPQRSFRSIEEFFGADGNGRRFVMRQMDPGEVILINKVTNIGEDAGVRSRLAPGMRAFTISVSVQTGVSGFLQPGDRVDIYWSGTDGDRNITKLLLEDVKLIAIDQVSDEDFNRPIVARTVTAEVSPEVVAKLVQAQNSGRLTLALRGTEDFLETGPLEVDQSAIVQRESIAVEVEEVCTVRQRSGTEVIITQIPCP